MKPNSRSKRGAGKTSSAAKQLSNTARKSPAAKQKLQGDSVSPTVKKIRKSRLGPNKDLILAERILTGLRLRGIREMAEKSRNEVALAIGVSHQFMAKIEDGRLGLSPARRKILCQYFGLPESAILVSGAEKEVHQGSTVDFAIHFPRLKNPEDRSKFFNLTKMLAGIVDDVLPNDTKINKAARSAIEDAKRLSRKTVARKKPAGSSQKKKR